MVDLRSSIDGKDEAPTLHIAPAQAECPRSAIDALELTDINGVGPAAWLAQPYLTRSELYFDVMQLRSQPVVESALHLSDRPDIERISKAFRLARRVGR